MRMCVVVVEFYEKKIYGEEFVSRGGEGEVVRSGK